MTRQNPTGPEPGRSTESVEEEEIQRYGHPRDWADEAAQARTADDPRVVAPHDRTGTPSTGDARGAPSTGREG